MFGKRVKNKINKVYIDLEPSYNGDKTGNAMFYNLNEWNASIGMFGILKVEFDIRNKTKNEIYFKQILNPTLACYKKLLFEDNVDMIITWNGKKFDIPLIINLFSLNEREQYNKKIMNVHRDLLKIRGVMKPKIKGSLVETTKRLKINIDTNEKDVSLDDFFDAWDIVFRNDNIETKEYKKALNIVKGRNKFDCKSLVLLEEYFDLSYNLESYDILYKNLSKKRSGKISAFKNKK